MLMQLMDMLVEQTHEVRYEWRNNERPLRFTDIRVDEQARGISLKSTPISLVLEASSGKSFVMNLLDTPGMLMTLSGNHRLHARGSCFVQLYTCNCISCFSHHLAMGIGQGVSVMQCCVGRLHIILTMHTGTLY